MRFIVTWIAGFLLFNCAIGVIAIFADVHSMDGHWSSASREAIGIAPDPVTNPEAIIQVYAARAYSWRGYFGVHSWISIKGENAPHFTNYEVLGWRVRQGGRAVSSSRRAPDSRWFGSEPSLIAELRGQDAADAIPKLMEAIQSYAHDDAYLVWPGPNSNTFIAHLGRIAPELRLDLPPTAVGKDFLHDRIWAESPSGTGYQVSLFGLLGVLAGREEGLEINILGLTYGVDPKDLSLKLPILGRLSL